MKANEDKLVEKLVDQMMKDSVLETPSLDFTTKVLSQVFNTKTNEVYVYKPLISKYVFILIFGCFITLFLYFLVHQEAPSGNWNNQLRYGNLFYNQSFLHFKFSEISIYSVVFATFLLLVQISFLKKHFDNQLEE